MVMSPFIEKKLRSALPETQPCGLLPEYRRIATTAGEISHGQAAASQVP